jgi:phosphoribosylformylglycinamidine synthase
MAKVRVIILRVAGTNCDFETEWAFNLCGAYAERVHINRIIEKEKKLSDYQILVIPGGFSYGDDIGAGKVLANEIRLKLYDEIEKFIEEKKAIIGICNGFQVLVKSGILPFNKKQLTTLEWNDSGRFEDRWVYLKVNKNNPSPLRELIIGMMPHPERAILKYYYPDFLREEKDEIFTPSFKIFQNMVKYFS